MDHLTTAQLIQRGRELRTTIDQAEAELETIESILRHRALAMPHEPLTDANREGRRATLRDESEQLKASFAADSPLAQDLLPLLSTSQIQNLFRKKTTYERAQKDGHKFRLLCAHLLDPELAGTVIDKLKERDKNGIVKSKSVIEWKAAS
jgi:hypothetical protein